MCPSRGVPPGYHPGLSKAVTLLTTSFVLHLGCLSESHPQKAGYRQHLANSVTAVMFSWRLGSVRHLGTKLGRRTNRFRTRCVSVYSVLKGFPGHFNIIIFFCQKHVNYKQLQVCPYRTSQHPALPAFPCGRDHDDDHDCWVVVDTRNSEDECQLGIILALKLPL